MFYVFFSYIKVFKCSIYLVHIFLKIKLSVLCFCSLFKCHFEQLWVFKCYVMLCFVSLNLNDFKKKKKKHIIFVLSVFFLMMVFSQQI